MALPLRRQALLLNVAVLVPVLAMLAWSARATYGEQIEQLRDETRALAATIVVYLERGLDLRALQTVIADIPLPSASVITVTDAQSVVLARSVEPEVYVGRRINLYPLPIGSVPQAALRMGADGVERVFSNDLYGAGPWLVSVGIPTSVAWQRVTAIYRRHAAVMLILGAVAIGVQLWLLRAYSRAFSRVIEVTGRVSRGDLTAPVPRPMPSREVELIQQALIEMVDRMREAREAIAAQVAEERRMREEVQSLQRQVIRQERLAAIGVLVSGVAHELNNPLQAILGFSELLQLRRDLPPHVRQELALIQKESARASAIIHNLSRFSRQQTTEPSVVRLHDVVVSVVELRQRKLQEHGISLQVAEHGNPTVRAVFTELQQVILNFVINAEQAVLQVEGPRRILVETREHDGCARLDVSDNGPGVPQGDEPKLFQPFFTTKAVGEGTGLGLSVSYGIIESHGGTIGYQPNPAGGATFFFELPALALTPHDPAPVLL